MIRLNPMPNSAKCQLCGHGPLTRFEVPDSSVLWRCEQCELYQFGQIVEEAAYESDYHDGYEKRRAQKTRTARMRLARLKPAIKRLMEDQPNRQPRFLEVGASVGCTLEAATANGWDAVGVDVSQKAVERCTSRGLDCRHVGPVELPFEPDEFDIVASWHVIEHVIDVRQTLSEWWRVLRPGGLLMIETPDASSPKVRRLGTRYRKFWAPEHTYTFTPANLASFFVECGFELIRAPRIAPLYHDGPADALYATMYQSYHSARFLAGVHKAFQLIARKPLVEEARPEPAVAMTLA